MPLVLSQDRKSVISATSVTQPYGHQSFQTIWRRELTRRHFHIIHDFRVATIDSLGHSISFFGFVNPFFDTTTEGFHIGVNTFGKTRWGWYWLVLNMSNRIRWLIEGLKIGWAISGTYIVRALACYDTISEFSPNTIQILGEIGWTMNKPIQKGPSGNWPLL